jgi:hypothetical protein
MNMKSSRAVGTVARPPAGQPDEFDWKKSGDFALDVPVALYYNYAYS